MEIAMAICQRGGLCVGRGINKFHRFAVNIDKFWHLIKVWKNAVTFIFRRRWPFPASVWTARTNSVTSFGGEINVRGRVSPALFFFFQSFTIYNVLYASSWNRTSFFFFAVCTVLKAPYGSQTIVTLSVDLSVRRVTFNSAWRKVRNHFLGVYKFPINLFNHLCCVQGRW